MILEADSIARFAGLLADRSRAAICLALLDGRAWTAAELASYAGIGRPTTSEHLNQLVEAGLLTQERQGRHRYVRLAGPELAQLIEDLGAVAGQPAPARSLRAVHAAADLAAARTCYDHLAGALGVQLFDGLVAAGCLQQAGGVALTEAGRSWFTELAGPQAVQAAGRRPLVRGCLDWTERRTHLGGALGAVLQKEFVTRGWLVRRPGHRAVKVTAAGQQALPELFGVRPAVVEAPVPVPAAG